MATHPFKPPGFLSLLASQTGESNTHGHANLLGSQTMDLDSPDLPGFSSNCNEDSTVKERRKWTPKEDIALVGAWLNTSKDPIVGNEQKLGSFWKRITDMFNNNPEMVGTQPRELLQCKQRWARINDHVCKFAGCFEAATREQASGQNDNDVMKRALDLFYNDHNVKFSLEHAWRELRQDQKWLSLLHSSKGGPKDKRKIDLDADGVEEVTARERPPGVKAAKAAKRNKKNEKEESMNQLQMMLEMKEKLSRQKMLELLLEKAELSETELTLKTKLLNEMIE